MQDVLIEVAELAEAALGKLPNALTDPAVFGKMRLDITAMGEELLDASGSFRSPIADRLKVTQRQELRELLRRLSEKTRGHLDPFDGKSTLYEALPRIAQILRGVAQTSIRRLPPAPAPQQVHSVAPALQSQKTPLTTFFAWQSWADASVSRNLIEWALDRALKKIGSAQEEPVLLDRDTKGLLGSPHIPSAILHKIDKASALVADITPFTEYVGTDGASHSVPNPNVMLEVGYAVARHGWERVILLMNTKMGKLRALPFDLPRSRVMSYELLPRSENESEDTWIKRRSTCRSALAGRLESALRPLFDDQGSTADRRRGLVSVCGRLYYGEVLGVAGDVWTLRLEHGLDGGPPTVTSLSLVINSYGSHPYVALSKDGVAWTLGSEANLTAHDEGVVLAVRANPSVARRSVHQIPKDINLSGLGKVGGKEFTPGGAAEVPSVLSRKLSIQPGEIKWAPEVGSDLSRLVSDFGRQQLGSLICIEVARLANVPDAKGEIALPFVKRVVSVRVLDDDDAGDWVNVEMALDVEGDDLWTGQVKVLVRPTG